MERLSPTVSTVSGLELAMRDSDPKLAVSIVLPNLVVPPNLDLTVLANLPPFFVLDIDLLS